MGYTAQLLLPSETQHWNLIFKATRGCLTFQNKWKTSVSKSSTKTPVIFKFWKEGEKIVVAFPLFFFFLLDQEKLLFLVLMYVNNPKSLAVKMLCMLLLHLSVILFVKSQLSFCSVLKCYFVQKVRFPDATLARDNFLWNLQKFSSSSSAS